LLQSSGWTLAGGAAANPSGHSLNPTLIYPRGDAARTRCAAAIADQARAAGFAINAHGMADSDFNAAVSSGAFDAALVAMPSGIDPDDSALLGSGGALNAGGYTSPAMDSALQAELATTPAQSQTAQQARAPLFKRIEMLASTDLPLYVLWQPRVYTAFSVTLGGVAGPGAQLDGDRSNSFYVDWFLTS